MPNYKIEPPIPFGIAALLVAVAGKPDNGFRLEPHQNVIDLVDLTQEESVELNAVLAVSGHTLVETDEEI